MVQTVQHRKLQNAQCANLAKLVQCAQLELRERSQQRCLKFKGLILIGNTINGGLTSFALIFFYCH